MDQLSIEISGFKSFADKVKLNFESLITVIVGPNGCGKSNIADSFRWVLGEASAKSLRGSKMSDVIFAGTTNRKPLNFAEVTITFNNQQNLLPIDYDQVAVTRRLHRSGDSEYFINRHPVRLKDVHGLFLDSGIGKDAYSIFEQGKIDEIINLPPLERRYIFEEAAGILRFLQRKREALKKLEQTEQNVSRVKDIHKEVEKQIVLLEDQAEKARLYKTNKKELEALEKALLVCKWNTLEARMSDIRHKREKCESEIGTITSQMEGQVAQLQESKTALQEAEKGLLKRGEEVFKTQSAKEIKSKEKLSNQERLREIAAKEKQWETELESMSKRRKERESERKRLTALQKEIEKKKAQEEKTLNTHREKVKNLDDQVNKLREQHQFKQKELWQLIHSENQTESEIRQTAVRIESAQEKQLQFNSRITHLNSAAKDLKELIQEKKKVLEEAVKITEEKKKAFGSTELNLKKISEEIERLEAQLYSLQQEITEGKARQKVLYKLREEMEGFSSGAKKLLNESSQKNSPLFQKVKGLYEYLASEKEIDSSLTSVMKPYSHTLVVEKEADFEEILSFIKKNKIKDVSLFCLEVVKNGVSTHFFKDIHQSKEKEISLKILKEHRGTEVCTPDGAFIDRRSVLFYATQGENNVFARETELKTLEKKLKVSENERAEFDQKLKELYAKRNQVQAERIELDKTIRKEEMKLMELNFSHQKAAADLEKVVVEEKQLTEDLKKNENVLKELNAHSLDLKGKFDKAKGTSGNTGQAVEELKTSLDTSTTVFKERSSELKQLEISFHQLLEEIRKNSHALHVLDIQDLESAQQEKRLQDEIEMGRLAQLQIKEKDIEAAKHLKEVEGTLVDVMAARAELEQMVEVKRKALNQMESKINEKRAVVKKLENEHNQYDVQTAQIESTLQGCDADLREKFNLSIKAARDEVGSIEMTQDQLEKQVRSLKSSLQDFGDINMTAIEECDKHKTRYEFLNQQMDDLHVSKQELVGIIAQLDDESRKLFTETFEKINANFKKNFKILFNGGEAELQFTQSEDVLEAGIEIIAKPPGKQMRSINLLSGGEKCLTAMALLFGIFEVKPSPFCILDEIDAPLDDTNVERFVNIVKQFTDRCRFIIITHNKRTMAIADTIYGVSMEERGVSKILSMNFASQAASELVTTT